MQTKRRVRKRPLYQNPKAVLKQRLLKGLKQKELGRLAELSEAQISKIERGESSASVEALHRLATVFECPVEELTAEELSAK